MRVTTAFNKILSIPGASVSSVTFGPGGAVVGLRWRAKRLTCPCGWSTRACYDRSTRRWRHLDLGAMRLVLQGEIRRLDCKACGRVRTEVVPWARPGARHSRDFEDVVAWLAQRVDKATVATLTRCSWEAVRNIVGRVVIEAVDDARLDELYRIGVDEISYRKGHRYLTIVADHDHGGRVVWAGEGKSADTLGQFYEELGEERKAKLEAISLDMGGAYEKATNIHAGHVRQCVDPFHVIKLANDAIDKTRRWVRNLHRSFGLSRARWTKHTRWALLKDRDALNDDQWEVLRELRRRDSVLYRCWQLKEGLRDLFRLANPARAPEHLDWWLA